MVGSRVGFSADLKALMNAGSSEAPSAQAKILAPAEADEKLENKIRELRASGRVVIRELPGQLGKTSETGVSEKLQKTEQGWTVVPLA